ALTHRWLLSTGLVPHAFEVLDKAAANFGVEPRYPFWDKPLVEFCLALPGEEKLKDGFGRHVLRRAMQGVLPPAVQWRRDKIDFTANLVNGMLGNHRELLDRLLISDSERIAPYVNLPAVAAVYDRMLRQP
ncbi:MAG: asparagine synthase, partial [Mesorhizobium sp.]